MTYPTEEKALQVPHKVALDARSHLTLTGVNDVESFDENMIVLYTAQGTLVVRGRDLHLKLLSLDGGQASVDGAVDSLTYEDDGRKAASGGFFGRLFG